MQGGGMVVGMVCVCCSVVLSFNSRVAALCLYTVRVVFEHHACCTYNTMGVCSVPNRSRGVLCDYFHTPLVFLWLVRAGYRPTPL